MWCTKVLWAYGMQAEYVTISAKTVPNGTFGISRNTILKH